jgi:2-haloacid dehalogenase
MTHDDQSLLGRRKFIAGLGTDSVAAVEANVATPATAEAPVSAVVPSICVFDVNETLLDIEFIAPLFHRLFGDRKVLREWFGQLVLYSEAITLSGPYTTFFTVLQMLGSIYGVTVQQADIEELRMRMLTMPPHPDVPTGLKQLKDAGFRLVTLSNSPFDPQSSPLKHADIDGWFEKSFSVDPVRRFKPSPQVYHMVAQELDVPLAAICMVAVHVWDTIGAQSVGCSGAFIARPGNAPLSLQGLPQPQAVASDLPGVATQIINLWA